MVKYFYGVEEGDRVNSMLKQAYRGMERFVSNLVV
jgi:hypothetical protein